LPVADESLNKPTT